MLKENKLWMTIRIQVIPVHFVSSAGVIFRVMSQLFENTTPEFSISHPGH